MHTYTICACTYVRSTVMNVVEPIEPATKSLALHGYVKECESFVWCDLAALIDIHFILSLSVFGDNALCS